MAMDRAQQHISKMDGAVRIPEPIGGPYREVQFSEEIERLWREPGWQGGRNSKTMVKHPDLRIVLTALKANEHVHEHRAAGSISVQTLTGHIRMHVPGGTFDLPAGRMVVLEQGLPHDIQALKDSAYLLTIAWAEDKAGHRGIRPNPGAIASNPHGFGQLPGRN